MTESSDEKAIEVMARALGERAVALEPKWEVDWPHLWDYDSNAAVNLLDLARAALDAYLKHCSSTLESVVMGEGGDVEDGEKETRN